MICYKFVSQEFYDDWNKRYKDALVQTVGKERAINNCAERIEKDFELIGTTAIEDKL